MMAQASSIEKFIESDCASYFYADCSRREFIEDTALTLRDLVNGKLKYSTGFRRLLLGRKGTGKTLLLRAIERAARVVYEKQNLTVCYIDYLNPTTAALPSLKIAESVGAAFCRSIKGIDEYLQQQNKFVLFIVDELYSVFGSCSIGKQIIGEIAEIGNSMEGRIHCIISGSSCLLRQLCFGKLPLENHDKFPNYFGIDLNSTKFSAYWIHPFLDKDDFVKVVHILHQKHEGSAAPDEVAMANIYFQTGGNGRHMENIIRTGVKEADTYSLSIKGISPDDLLLLQAIFTCVTSFIPGFGAEFEHLVQWTRYVPVSSALRERGVEYGEAKKLLNNLADRGLIRFKDRWSLLGSGPEVSLATPMIYLELASIDKCNLTPQEAAALLYPAGPLSNTAERVAMRFLIENAEKWINHGIKLRHREYHQLCYTKQTNQGITELSKLSEEELIHCFWKEVPDSYGADAVFVELKDDGYLVAHRIQLKLGTRRIDMDTANQIVQMFSSQKDEVCRVYSECKKTLFEQKFYLVTTRPLGNENSQERKALMNGHVIIVDAARLTNTVWPDVVKSLGKPYK